MVTGHEAFIDELIGRAAVHEEDGGMTCDEPIQLDEAARVGDELVNLTRRRWGTRVAGIRGLLPYECREPVG